MVAEMRSSKCPKWNIPNNNSNIPSTIGSEGFVKMCVIWDDEI